MPTLKTFSDKSKITIFFYDTDRHQAPHYHIRSNKGRAVVRIVDNVVPESELPERDLRTALDWAHRNHNILVTEWNRCNPHRPISG